MDQELEARLRAQLDKQEIHDTLMRYIRGVDRVDATLISRAFHDDAVSDHGAWVFVGPGIGEQIVAMEQGVPRGAMHFVGNHVVEVEGDEAYSESSFLNLFLDREGGERLNAKGARYVDRWERRDGEWRIAYRIVVNEWWGTLDLASGDWPSDAFHLAERSRDDPVFTIRRVGPRRPGETSHEFLQRAAAARSGG
jgi:hypothetical protein